MKADKELRAAIIKLHLAGKSNTKIAKLFPNETVTPQFVYKQVKRFKETGGIEDRPGRGRPVTKRTPEAIKRIREKVRRNPNRSMRKMAKEESMAPRYHAEDRLEGPPAQGLSKIKATPHQ